MANFLFVVVVGVLYFIALRRPGAACGYVLAGFSLEQCAQAFVPLAGRNDSLCNYLIAMGVVLALATTLMRDGLSSLPIRVPAMMMLLLLGYCYASSLWSLFPSATRRLLNVELPYLVVFVALTPLLIRRSQDLRDCITSLTACAGLALTAILLFARWGHRGLLLPYAATESNPLSITQAAGALLIAVTLSPALGQLRPPLKQLIGLGLLLVVTVSFLRTGSRGQIVAAVSTVLLFSASKRGRNWAPLALLAMVGLALSGFLAEEVAKNASRWDPDVVQRDISSGRVGEAEELLNFWSRSSLKHILFGLGHATAQDPRLLGAYPHVVPAEVLAEEGLVGALLYAMTLLSAARFYVHGIRRSSPQEDGMRGYLRAMSAMTLYEFLLTLKQGTLLGQPSFLLLLVLSGAAAAGAEDDEDADELDAEDAEDPEAEGLGPVTRLSTRWSPTSDSAGSARRF